MFDEEHNIHVREKQTKTVMLTLIGWVGANRSSCYRCSFVCVCAVSVAQPHSQTNESVYGLLAEPSVCWARIPSILARFPWIREPERGHQIGTLQTAWLGPVWQQKASCSGRRCAPAGSYLVRCSLFGLWVSRIFRVLLDSTHSLWVCVCV